MLVLSAQRSTPQVVKEDGQSACAQLITPKQFNLDAARTRSNDWNMQMRKRERR